MKKLKYPLPSFLVGRCTQAFYSRWLQRKAATHCKRDRRRGNKSASIEGYKAAIHSAVKRSKGLDAYTGKPMKWKQISKYNSQAAKRGGRKYKNKFRDLPTVDHVGDGIKKPVFRICSWRINDAKNDRNLNDFIRICEEVLCHQRNKRMTIIK